MNEKSVQETVNCEHPWKIAETLKSLYSMSRLAFVERQRNFNSQ